MMFISSKSSPFQKSPKCLLRCTHLCSLSPRKALSVQDFCYTTFIYIHYETETEKKPSGPCWEKAISLYLPNQSVTYKELCYFLAT